MSNRNTRTVMAAKNVAWAYVNTVATTVLKFAVRWAFIKTIGATYLGINGLYTSILGVLSLTELGIGSAMNYSLYKPVAADDREKIKSLMQLYKQAYRIIAVIISILGLAIVPFLSRLIKGAEGVEHLTLYYLLFLFNTVSSYFVSYKYGLVHADQKNYIVNNIHTVAAIATCIIQIAVLFLFRSFLAYLLASILFQLFEKVYAYFYIDKCYGYLRDKNIIPLEKEEKGTLFRNVKALFVHKFGDVAVNQTDNLIISSCLNVTITGLISNYTLITGTVDSFLAIIFSNITGSLGNLCTTESKQRQYEIYKIYDSIGFWLFGFAAIAYAALIQPFTQLMWGDDYVVDFWPILLIIINTYIVGQRVPLNNIKVARGIFAADQYLAFFQAITNLVTSILFVKMFGLIGVYMGTILSGLIPTILRPILVYRELFDKPVSDYFLTYIKHLSLIAALGAATCFCTNRIMSRLNIASFIAAVVFTAVVPNALILLLTRKTGEFAYVKRTALQLLKRGRTVR